MSKKKKVVFLTKYPEKGASSRYRVYQYLSCFKEFYFKTHSLMGGKSFSLIYVKGKTFQKVYSSLKDYLSRSFFVLKNLDADVIYMQREVFAYGPLWVENLYKILGKKMIFDLDDALFINQHNDSNPFKWDKAARVKSIIKKTDLVIAGNSWIRDKCLELGAKKAIHIDVAEVVRYKNVERSKNNPLKALWLGSPTTSKYLKLIEEALKDVQDSYGLEINIVGGQPLEEYKFESTNYAWSKEVELEYLKKSDIGLMPLPMADWSKGKCGGKARTYMASGLIPIVSNIGYNKELIEHKKTGFLCNDTKDWISSLEEVINTNEVRKVVRNNSYAIVEDKFNKKKIAAELTKQILKLIENE